MSETQHRLARTPGAWSMQTLKNQFPFSSIICEVPGTNEQTKAIELTMKTTTAKTIQTCLHLALACGVIALSGCASIVSGTKQKVKITSVPDAADVKVERVMSPANTTEWEGKTPTDIKLSRKGRYLVTVSLTGYQKAEIPIESGGMNGWIWGNIAFGGIIGVIIDTSNGAAMTLKPDEINVQLVACKTAQAGQPAGVYAMIYTAAPDGKTECHAFPLKTVGAN